MENKKGIPLNGFICGDCMDYLPSIPDNYFDLAMVDPPYGKVKPDENHGIRFSKNVIDKMDEWNIAPTHEYFEQLFRVSRNQIIWGGNYFDLPPTGCFLIWRKTNVSETFRMAMAEYAWTSFDGNAKVFDFSAVGQEGRFHPTQKPVELYKWILYHYANKGDRILDTHVGSASSLIACEDLGFRYLGFEIDPDYYEMAKKRIDDFNAQLSFRDLLP